MTDASVTPGTIGGRFTNVMPWMCQPAVTAQEGGRIRNGGFTGSGSSFSPNYTNGNDGSAAGITGNWSAINLSEGLKAATWSSVPFTTFYLNYAIGSLEPVVLGSNGYWADDSFSSTFPGTMAYYDNDAGGGSETGLSDNWVRTSGDWGTVSSNPAPDTFDTGSVKSYPDNQFTFDPVVPVSSFQQIMSYMSVDNPALPAAGYPLIDYESAWDIFGHAHYDNQTDGHYNISLEIMFWTRNHFQSPAVGPKVETGVDLNGDGKLWDLWMTASTAENGGVSDKYSYAIWYLQDAYQEEAGWVNILAGLRYVLMHYVVTSGVGAPPNPLDVPLVQVCHGWEICSTNYLPLEFRHLDYRLEMA